MAQTKITSVIVRLGAENAKKLAVEMCRGVSGFQVLVQRLLFCVLYQSASWIALAKSGEPLDVPPNFMNRHSPAKPISCVLDCV